jgi:predicted outer membrane repeat protein
MILFRKLLFFVVATNAGILLFTATSSRAAVDTVTTAADNGPGSLRAIIAAANSGDTVVFSPSLKGETIYLTTGGLFIGKNLTIDASALPGGIAIDGGGNFGVMQTGGDDVIKLTALTLTNGYTSGTGGGLLVGGGTTLTANACTFSGNSAVNDFGGGIYADSATVVLNGCAVTGNFAFNGGGGIYENAAPAGSAILNNCTISGNSAPSGEGGGIYNDAMLALNNCSISANTAVDGGSGGGIMNLDILTASNCTLSANSADGGYGGGIVNGNQMTLNNCTICGNSADDGFGGGLFTLSATNILVNCTICGNSAVAGGYGGGIYNVGSVLALTNTIVATNTTDNGGDIYGPYSGPANFIGGNPKLAGLANYGGGILTMAPEFGSPVIDAGTDWATNGLNTAQRGDPRLSGSHVDIGAVEAQFAPVNNRPVLRNATAYFAGSNSISFQFSFTNAANADFTVLTTTNLALPPSQWMILGNMLEGSPGKFQFIQLIEAQHEGQPAVSNAQQFFRVVSP